VNPRFPLYIPSKSRADKGLTAYALDVMKVPYHVVVEAEQFDDYAKFYPAETLLVLPPEYLRDYDTFDDPGDAKSKGPGAARNFIWDHSIAAGYEWHWVMDDNIPRFARLHKNVRTPVGDGTMFYAMEDFCLRYSNIAMAGPQYWMFAANRAKMPPFIVGTRIYSCNLIRNDVPFRWRGRYNEDTDLSLRMLKAGWATVQFNAFLQFKSPTQLVPGGNTKEFYDKEGTLPKSEMLVKMHPDVARLAWRFGRWHHYVDYRPYRGIRLLKRKDYTPPEENPYHLVEEFRPVENRKCGMKDRGTHKVRAEGSRA